MGSTITSSTPSNANRLSTVIKKEQYKQHTHDITINTEYKLQKKTSSGYTQKVTSGGAAGTAANLGSYPYNTMVTWISACYDYGSSSASNCSSQTGYFSGDRCWDSWWHGTAYFNPDKTIYINQSGRGSGVTSYTIYKYVEGTYVDDSTYIVVPK